MTSHTPAPPQSPGGAPDPGPVEQRIALQGRSLRAHAARGTIINGAFEIGLAGLGVARQVLLAALLTTTQFGLWGLVFGAVAALLFLMEIGVSDKFVQQAEHDQEAAFQKAFTINLVWRCAFLVLILLTIPVFAAIYGRSDIILPGVVLSVAVIGSALQSPLWIYYRQMRFGRQRALQAIEPVVGLAVTAALGFAGAGVWSLVIGGVAGHWTAGLVALKSCPYPIRLRFDRRMFGEYFSFSWPITLAAGSGALMSQIGIIVGQRAIGIAGVGAIGLAATIARFSERVDQILSQTMYPAICAVRDQVDLLFESFVKSNRIALMWGTFVGFGLALFAPDVVRWVVGEKWAFATGVIQVFGVLAALAQIAFNWTSYFLAIGNTRPLAINGALMLATFVVVGVPLTIADGLTGYAIGMAVVALVDLSVRAYYLTRLFSGFAMLRHAARAMAPSVPAVGAVLAARVIESGERTLGLAVGELVLYAGVTAVATWAFERDLLRELAGYLRGSRSKAPQPA